MSHKIKILAEDQYLNLVSKNSNIIENKIRLYISSLLPGLFYSASEKIKKIPSVKYLYIPPDNWPESYSTRFIDRFIYSKFELASFDVKVGRKLFIPIIEGNLIAGGFFGSPEDIENIGRDNLIKEYSLDESLHHLFEIGNVAQDDIGIADSILEKISSEKSFDSFMRQLPEWIIDSIGGGSAAYYYGSEDSFFLRKIAGGIGELEKMPALLNGELLEECLDCIREEQLYSPAVTLPDFPAELNYQPLIRFAIGGSSEKEMDYIILGQLPDVTSMETGKFLSQLHKLLEKISLRHFTSISNWRNLFSTLDKMAESSSSLQEFANYLFNSLNDSIMINHLTICRFHHLENRLQIEGFVSPKSNDLYHTEKTFPISGTWYEDVIDSGRARFDELSKSNLDNKIKHQLYKDGVRSHIILPVQSGDMIYGFLSIGSSVTGAYLRGYLTELDSIARYMAKIHEKILNNHKIEVLTDQLGQLHNKLTSIENMRTLGELAGGVFHDLNNVIGAILGRSQLILQKAESRTDDELIGRISRDASLIEKSALDSGEILKRLKQLARSERKGKKEPINLQELIDDSIEMIQPRWERLVQRSGLKITLEKEPVENITINAEASEIREVFTNVLLNALDAMPDGGRISIICRQIKHTVRITISDTGSGMPPEIIEKIFTPFFTTKGEKGTGLGLPLSKKIIENHSGTLEVESKVGEGTSFVITLPIIEKPDAVENENSISTGSGPKLNILIAEDSLDLQDTMFEMLSGEGFKVIRASSGEEVLRLCGVKRFDMLITDLGLPGISGLELARHIKSIDKNIKIILTSGWEINKSISELMDNGVDCYLAKPFKIDQLRESIKSLFK